MRDKLLQQAIAEHLSGDLESAQKKYLQLLEMNPSDPDALYKLGLLAFQADSHEIAVGYFRRVITMYPQEVKLRVNLAHALMITGLDGARESLQVALELDPEYVAALSTLGTLHIYDGEIEEAKTWLNKAIQIDPYFSEAYAQLGSLVRTGKHTFSDEQLKNIRHIINDETHDGVGRSVVMYALAHHIDKQGDYERAFEHYRAANEYRRTILPARLRFNENELIDSVDKSIKVFSKEFVKSVQTGGSESELPVFIVGQMRSGTSLVEQIVFSHSRATGVGELNYVHKIARFGIKLLHADDPYPEAVRHIDPAEFLAPANEYLENLERRAGEGDWQRITDKMPGNSLYLGLIWLMFPNARVIHVRRNPLDSCLSMYFNNLSQGFTTDLTELGIYHRQYHRIAAHWEQVLPLKIKTVQYQELVADPEKQIRELIGFLDLDWEDDCLKFYESSRRVRTPSAMQVREPVHAKAIARWKRYDKYLTPLKQALGEEIMAEIEAVDV